MARIIALASSRGGGDWHPTAALAFGLCHRGHELTLVCDDSVATMIGSCAFEVIRVPRQPPQGSRPFQFGTCNESSNDPLAQWAASSMSILKTAFSDMRPNLILSPLMGMRLAIQLAERFQVPWCLVNPGFYFGEESCWQDDFHPHAIDRFQNLFLPLSRRADFVLHATLPEFDITRRLPQNHFMVGPLLWNPPISSSYDQSWSSSCILVSISSAPQDNELAIVRAALEGLAEQDLQVLVTLPEGHSRSYIETASSTSTVLPFVPHGALLPKTEVHISHGGHGTVMRDLFYGVPTVLVPWDRDQLGVSARAVHMGVAICVQRQSCSPNALADAVSTIRSNCLFKERTIRMSRLIQSRDSVRIAAEILEERID